MSWVRVIRRLIAEFPVFLLVVCVFAFATQVKLSQYESGDSSNCYLKATKMNESRAEKGHDAPPAEVVRLEPDTGAPAFVFPVETRAAAGLFFVSGPIASRPPPATAGL